jgi:hypothetical protein
MNNTPTPRTDAAELTEPYEIRALGFCVVPIDFARQLERERDDWEEHAIKFADERESNAMQALAYKAERDAALDALRKWDAVCVAADACNAEMESDEYSQTQWEAFEQKHTDLLECANRARLAVLFPANATAQTPPDSGTKSL